MTATSRKTARKALGALLKTNTEGTGKPAQAVYDYLPYDFAASPVVCVLSGGTRSKRVGIGQTKAFNTVYLEVWIFIASANVDPGWTADVAQDAWDDCEAAVRDTVIANPTNAAWTDLHFSDRASEIVPALIGNKPYDLEKIFLEAQVNDV